MLTYYTSIHISFSHFIYYLINKYLNVIYSPYAYIRWEDAVKDYLDVYTIEEGIGYPLFRPDNMTPNHWINEYIENIFKENFPESHIVYLEG